MKVLLLSPYDRTNLEAAFRTFGDEWVQTGERVTVKQAKKFDVGVSYGYRHIIKQPILDTLKIINLHISYLPWNRGADPNLWSWIDGTPKGVTIHYMDEGLDTGDILAQKLVPLDENGTLESTYAELRAAIENLFIERWPELRLLPIGAPQAGQGTAHRVKDAPPLPLGYRTPVRSLHLENKILAART